MIVLQGRGGQRRIRPDIDALSTEQLIALHERHFGPLEQRSKERIVDSARLRGWDRTWEMDGLAA
jgi:hypothetical protein